MKNLMTLLMLFVAPLASALANDPVQVNGLYITTQSYNYDFNNDIWNVTNHRNQKIIVDIENGFVTFDNNMYGIVKTKNKVYKKTGVQEFEIRLVDERNETCIATFVISPDKNNEPVIQLYLSNAETEASFDLTR